MGVHIQPVEGSASSTVNGRLGHTSPPKGEEVMDKPNALGAKGWNSSSNSSAQAKPNRTGPCLETGA